MGHPKYKARLVARGDYQQSEVEYDETFTSTSLHLLHHQQPAKNHFSIFKSKKSLEKSKKPVKAENAHTSSTSFLKVVKLLLKLRSIF